jgi:perosamine synthetase
MYIGLGDQVIVPDYTYPATADVVQIVGANIVILDVERETMLIDYEAIEQAITPRTKAVIPVSATWQISQFFACTRKDSGESCNR